MLTTVSVVFPATHWESRKMTKFHFKILTLIFPLLLFAGIFKINAQDVSGLYEGKVSYLTSQNIYVRFESTEEIESGDTLFIRDNNQWVPALVVVQQSSVSCLCDALGDKKFKIDEPVFHRKKTEAKIPAPEPETAVQPEKDLQEEVLTTQPKTPEKTQKQLFTGRISASSHSSFSNLGGNDIHRFRYTLSANAAHISGSILSAETYIIFTHRQNQWHLVQENLNNALKIYNLALKFDLNESAVIRAGRKINPHIANIGAIDGLQFEYNFKKLYAGAAVGSRPDYMDYSYNFNLFEYGAYVGQSQRLKNGFVQSSLAFFEQKNSGNVDRRFIYLQHTNSAVKNLNLFSSVELDLYRLEEGQPTNALSLTSLYFSLNYRASKKLTLFGSYDNRKNVIYYETFRSFVDEILNQASRQGYHFRINYRPVNNIVLSLNTGLRFKQEDSRKTKTLNGNLSFLNVSGINAPISLTASFLQTSYLDGRIFGTRLSKDIIPGKIYSMVHYRWAELEVINSIKELTQHIGEVDFSYQINKKLFLTVNFEATFQEDDLFNRLYLSLGKKF